MNNERAIELLHRLQDEQFDGIHGDERREALSMAVRALIEPNIGQKTIDCIIKRLDGEDTAQPTQTNADSTQTNTLDCVDRQEAIDAVYSETVSTNPEHFKSSEKFIKFMDDDDIASFGKWQWANGFNTAVVAARIQLEKLPSAQPERKRSEWIPCSERLPEHNQQILAYYADIDRIMLISYNSNGITLMTAWMPLPKPYGGESE
jgi:hypothetical protein